MSRECVIHYECRTIQRNDVDPDTLTQAIRDGSYAAGDFHRVYYGEIVAAYAEPDVVRSSELDDQELLLDAPLLIYLAPGRFAEVERSNAFPFPARMKK